VLALVVVLAGFAVAGVMVRRAIARAKQRAS